MADAFTRPRRRPPLDPLTPRLREKLPKKTIAEHGRLVERFEQATARERQLGVEIERARQADRAAAERAVAGNKAIPEATVDALLIERDHVRRELDAVDAVIGESSAHLLQAAAPAAPGLAAELVEQALQVEDRALAELHQAHESFAAADTLRAEASWLLEVAASANPAAIRPFGGQGSGEPARLLAQSIQRIEFEVAEARKRRARWERSEQADQDHRAQQQPAQA